MKATFEGRFQSIKAELDLTIEAANMKRAEKVYAYDKEVPQIGTFTNTTSARLFGGVKPTQTVMMQRKAEGTTLKKYIAVRTTAAYCGNQLQDIFAALSFLRTGSVPGASVAPFPGDPPAPGSYGARGLDADLVRITHERLAENKANFLSEAVVGTGPVADRIRGSLSAHLGPEPHDPAASARDFLQTSAAGKEIGPDEEGNVGDLIMEVFLDLTPGLRDRLGAFLRRDDVAGDNFYDPGQASYAVPHFARVLPEADEKERLLADLGTTRLHPIHARALLDAAHDEGLGLPDADILALFAPGRPAGEALRAALGGFELDVDTASLRQLARGAIRSGRATIA